MSDKKSSSSQSKRSNTMDNGHNAGMQSGKQFGERERVLRNEKDAEMKAFDKNESGANADTTYRDKRGKKLDMLNQFMRQQAIQEGKVGTLIFIFINL